MQNSKQTDLLTGEEPLRPTPGSESNDSKAMPKVILLLGATGVGKSSFIAKTTGLQAVVGHGLDSCTAKCDLYEFQDKSGAKFILIDTPGFDDTTRDDLDILSTISTFLNDDKLPNISGIIYFHRIMDKRVTGMSRLNLEITQAICGALFYPRVALVTTMWDKIPNKAVWEECETREGQLNSSKSYWGDMIAQGCPYSRFLADCPETGLQILRLFLQMDRDRPLQIQTELLLQKHIEDTTAGSIILREKQKREKQRTKELMEEQQALLEEERALKESRNELARQAQKGHNRTQRPDTHYGKNCRDHGYEQEAQRDYLRDDSRYEPRRTIKNNQSQQVHSQSSGSRGGRVNGDDDDDMVVNVELQVGRGRRGDQGLGWNVINDLYHSFSNAARHRY